MDENETQIAEPQKPLREIVQPFGVDFPIEVIDNPENPRLAEVAALDAELFGEHKSLTEEEFSLIIDKGGVILGHVGPEGKLISEATLVMEADTEGQSLLEQQLPEWLAYCDGAAVSKSYRGKGLQKQLLNAREAVAKEAGKEAAAASVRQQNLASIRSMLSSGYIMLADSPHYYGDEASDARVVMVNDFKIGNPFMALDSDHEMLEESLRGVIEPNELTDKLAGAADVISLAVQQSDDVNSEYNKAVATLLRNGYVGVSCNDIDIGDSENERSDAMTFVRIDSLPAESAAVIKARQQEIQAIVGQQQPTRETAGNGQEITFSLFDPSRRRNSESTAESHTGVFFVGGRTTTETQGEASEPQFSFYLTDNPEFMSLLADKRIKTFKDLPYGSEQHITILVPRKNNKENDEVVADALTLHLSQDGIMSVIKSGATIDHMAIPPSLSPDEISIANAITQNVGGVASKPPIVNDPLCSSGERPSKNPALDTILDKLGFAYTDKNHYAFPIPQRFIVVWGELQRTNTSGVYLPDLKLFEGGSIPGDQYLHALADGQFPIDTTGYYLHDAASEHIVALMLAGEPLMDLMSVYSGVICDAKQATFRFYDSISETWEERVLVGSGMIDEAALRLDRITMFVHGMIVDGVQSAETGIETSDASRSRNGQEFSDMVETIRAEGRLGELQVVKELIADGTALTESEITSEQIADRILANALKNCGPNPRA